MLQSKYAAKELQRALKDVFESKTLGQATTRLVIPSIDLAKGQTVVFKTPHLPDLTRDRHFSAVDVLLATAAAPTYFPHATIQTGSAYCDGGLWANNPSMVAFAEALKMRSCCGRPVDPRFEVDEIKMLSVGTGKVNYSLVPATDAKTGLVWWGPKLIDLIGNSQAQGVNFQTEYVLGDRLHRVDFLLPDDTWKLDAIKHIDTLIHCGREKAHEELPKIKTKFFSGEKRTFHPFD
jgi:patatin-like phospholipase/acyl hydrolase